MAEYGYAIVKVMKGLDFRPTNVLVDVVGIATTRDAADKIAKAKSEKSYNYVYLVKKVYRY